MSYQFGHVDRDERIEYVDEPPPPPELPPRWRLPPAVLAVGVMAVFAGGLWFAYHEGAKRAASATAAEDGQVPLIHADNQPIKVKPDRPGGMSIPDQDDPIFTRKSSGQGVERLLPPPEQPAPRPAAPPPPAASAPPPAASAPAPAAPAPPAQVAEVPPPKPPASTKPAPSPKPAAPSAPAAPPKPAAQAAPAAKAASVTGGTKIQLASVRSPEAARDEWQRLKREYPDLLGHFTAVAVRAEVPDKGTYYRVEAGPVGDRAAAERLCKALRGRGLGCSLVR